MTSIKVEQLAKTYQVPVREAGLGNALKSLFRRETRDVPAVTPISFTINPGEVVGFLGPNGAGKTTTIKMLSGLLHPSGGKVSVLGFEPAKRERDFLRRITLVMGQRNQLLWDIPAIDSFERNRAIYELDRGRYRETLAQLTELLDLEPLLTKPVRNLSLGERMKCEVAVSLLHEPDMLFLDEPTIGLDVTMQRKLRQFIADYNQRTGATVLLTSHYMADVQALCKRVIVIHHGAILFDGDLAALVEQFTAYKTITVKLPDATGDYRQYGELVARSADAFTLRLAKSEAPAVTARLLADLPVVDLSVEDPPIEEVIDSVFTQRAEA
ncbi:MAG: ATP-binding cassette domain-containing protein [Pseudomonadota bacterium]